MIAADWRQLVHKTVDYSEQQEHLVADDSQHPEEWLAGYYSVCCRLPQG